MLKTSYTEEHYSTSIYSGISLELEKEIIEIMLLIEQLIISEIFIFHRQTVQYFDRNIFLISHINDFQTRSKIQKYNYSINF